MLATLWASRKFRIMAFDLVIAAVLHFGAEYLSPSVMADVNWFLVGAQPILISLVLGIAIEDSGTNANPALVALPEPSVSVPSVWIPGNTPPLQGTITNGSTTPPASMVDPAKPVG
jgi:hypothetical protein